MPASKIEFWQWVYVAIAAPLLGGLGGWLREWWSKRLSAKRRKERIVKVLSGLPPESKAILIDFHNHGTHTRRTDLLRPGVKVLVTTGILQRGPGGGTYDAVDSYMIINPNYWEVMDDWMVSDIISMSLLNITTPMIQTIAPNKSFKFAFGGTGLYRPAP